MEQPAEDESEEWEELEDRMADGGGDNDREVREHLEQDQSNHPVQEELGAGNDKQSI